MRVSIGSIRIVFCLVLCMAGVALSAQNSLLVKEDGTVAVDKNLTVGGDETVSGNETVNGTATVNGTLNVKKTKDAQNNPIKGNVVAEGTVQAAAGFGYVPVGTILPWYNKKEDAQLPPGWFKCNGITLKASDGLTAEGDVLDGTVDGTFVTPDLNNYSTNGGRFLRGGTVAGVKQDDTFLDHEHWRNSIHVDEYPLFSKGAGVGGYYGTSGGYNFGQSWTGGNSSSPRAGTETRPANMSVIFIIRVY